jgi:hypothetical protein
MYKENPSGPFLTIQLAPVKDDPIALEVEPTITPKPDLSISLQNHPISTLSRT